MIEQLSNLELYHIIRAKVSSGFMTVVQMQVMANNYHVNPEFNPNADTPRHIVYLDKNSFYPGVVCHPLPERDFRKLTSVAVGGPPMALGWGWGAA